MLMITAVIWGSAFVAQSVGMDHVGPFTFTAARSFVGFVVLLPVIFLMDALRRREGAQAAPGSRRDLILGGVACGVILCVANSLQQVGMAMGTSAGKAGFITALYILGVPLLGLLLGKRVRPVIWLCVAMSIGGLYLLCVTEGLESVQKSDLMVLLCAVCFAGHIQVIDYFSPRVDGVRMSCIQFLVCGILASVPMMLTEEPCWSDLVDGAMPILYAGVMSSGVAYTLQIVGQKYTNPTVASMIMSLESVFAMLTGVVVLGDFPTAREVLGSAVMFAAIIIAQLPEKKRI
ncbi:MAG: DMT family transporter [Candidatus Heteroscillospira sp.]